MNFKILGEKNFFLLMLGKLVSLIGSELQNFALSLYVLKMTGSATKFASVLAVTMIPRLILGPVAGVFVDRLDRKKIIYGLDMVSGILIGIYALMFYVSGELTMTSIYILVIILSFISVLFQPAISTVIPTIMKKEELVDANSINSFVMSIGGLVAPAMAGVLFGFYGIFVILVINSISFILSSISEMFIDIPKINKESEKTGFNSFRYDFAEGIKYIKSDKLISTIICFSCIVNFAFPAISSIGLVYMAKKVLMVSDAKYGLMDSLATVSTIIAPFFASRILKKYNMGEILFLDIFIVGILTTFIGGISTKGFLGLFSSSFIPYILLIITVFFIWLVITIGNTALSIIIQKKVPLELLGRVNTVMGSLGGAAQPAGQILYGVIFDRIATWICFIFTAFLYSGTSLAFRKNLCSSGDEDYKKAINN